MKLDVDGLKANAAKIVLSTTPRAFMSTLAKGPREQQASFKPPTFLVEYGFARREELPHGRCRYTITDAGRQWLKERGL